MLSESVGLLRKVRLICMKPFCCGINEVEKSYSTLCYIVISISVFKSFSLENGSA